MSWKRYIKLEIKKFEDDMDKKYPELHTMLKRCDNYGEFFDSAENFLSKEVRELAENEWETEDMYSSFLNDLDEAFAVSLDHENA